MEEKIQSSEFEFFNEEEGKYYRNNEYCTAKIIYPKEFIKSAKPQFCLIEKNKAPWDNHKEKTYSIGWKCNDKHFVLGLPTQEKDLAEIKKLIDKLVGDN